MKVGDLVRIKNLHPSCAREVKTRNGLDIESHPHIVQHQQPTTTEEIRLPTGTGAARIKNLHPVGACLTAGP